MGVDAAGSRRAGVRRASPGGPECLIAELTISIRPCVQAEGRFFLRAAVEGGFLSGPIGFLCLGELLSRRDADAELADEAILKAVGPAVDG